jgi:hypothetical protein
MHGDDEALQGFVKTSEELALRLPNALHLGL